MFTGIIQAVGKIVKYDGNRLAVRASFPKIRLGESISIDGVCLTVSRKSGSTLFFDVGPETRRVTTLGSRTLGHRVNLERALRVGDRVGGHWVTGHVEQTGQLKKIEPADESRWLSIELPKNVLKYVIDKGSLAVDGVSLTVAEMRGAVARIMLIPHTLSHTTLGDKKTGDRVNIEPDLLAKYAERLHVKF
jgi:riboflavin synthase